jgi:hypothetical protein
VVGGESALKCELRVKVYEFFCRPGEDLWKSCLEVAAG